MSESEKREEQTTIENNSKVPLHEMKLPQVYEEGLRKKLNRWAQIRCKKEISEFVECSKDKFLNVIWECKPQNNAMNICLHKYTSEWYMSQLRFKYLNGELNKNKKETFEEMKEEK